jgi:hypothetical protein
MCFVATWSVRTGSGQRSGVRVSLKIPAVGHGESGVKHHGAENRQGNDQGGHEDDSLTALRTLSPPQHH